MDIRVHACAATTALAAVCAGPAMAASLFAATLSGGQEVPSSGSPHTGTATFELLGAGTATPSLAFDMLFDPAFDFGLDGNVGPQQVVGLHIHRAPRDQNGSVVYGIISPSSEVLGFSDVVFSATADGATRITGEWDADEGLGGLTFSDFAAIFDDTAPGTDTPFYVNLHTTDFPGGEIRGQIVAAPSPVPLPATLPMLAGGVLLLALRRRAG